MDKVFFVWLTNGPSALNDPSDRRRNGVKGHRSLISCGRLSPMKTHAVCCPVVLRVGCEVGPTSKSNNQE